MPAVPTPIATPSDIDLISGTYATNVLLAGGITLSTAQATILSDLVTAASREIIRYCSRKFTLQTYIEIVTPEGGRQDRGEPASAKLAAFPVQSVTSIMTGRSTVLTIANTDTSTNQFASVAFSLTGDVEYRDLTYTGLTLSRTASGMATTTSLPFSSHVTLTELATAINALGNGWSATLQSRYALYPSAALVGVREPQNALSQGAGLDLFTRSASGYDIDRSTGIIHCYGGSDGSNGWGDLGSAWDGQGGTLGWNQYRVEYTAGWATVPENLQQVCAETVKGIYARLEGNPNLRSETADRYSYQAKDSLANLPDWAQYTLNTYKDYST